MSAAQILNERGSKSGREALVIGETYPWRRDHSPDRSMASRHSKLRCISRTGCGLE